MDFIVLILHDILIVAQLHLQKSFPLHKSRLYYHKLMTCQRCDATVFRNLPPLSQNWSMHEWGKMRKLYKFQVARLCYPEKCIYMSKRPFCCSIPDIVRQAYITRAKWTNSDLVIFFVSYL